MTELNRSGTTSARGNAARGVGQLAIYPLAFSISAASPAAGEYLREAAARKLVEFFEAKGLAALKEEDRREAWYGDWIEYQAAHGLYAAVLSPKEFSTRGSEFDLLRYARFLEVFGYCSPAHGYSLQVSFLGLFSILMGSQAALKREAVAALEAGGLFALGISEKEHGADLFGNEFVVTEGSPGEFVANGAKYYIGNSNSAAMISILARKQKNGGRATHSKRAPFVLFALRPNGSGSFINGRKIRTLGVRGGYVGAFDVNDHRFPEADLIATGRDAWDASFGAVTLGKFFLGFASIGICEHAWHEAINHLSGRVLYDKPVIKMPHIRLTMAQAFTRLTAMKMFAYRALDYIHAANAEDRRYILFAAVQKARVSTQGVKVMALLSECIGAKGFEAETFFEMALRDVQLIPSLEGSTHLNLGLAAQFAARYFAQAGPDLAEPPSLIAGEIVSRENGYLMEARNGAIPSIFFAHFLAAYRPLLGIRNVRLFTKQIKAFRLFVRSSRFRCAEADNTQLAQAMGACLAVIVYGQLIAENAKRIDLPAAMVSAIFHTLIDDLSAAALAVAALPGLHALDKLLIRRVVAVPQTDVADWTLVAGRMV